MDQHEPPATRSEAELIAHNLNRLFRDHRQPDGRKHTNEGVAAFVSEAVGEPVSRYWISKLRDATINRPDPARLEAVAKFFGESTSYLRGETPEDIEQLRSIATMVDELQVQGVHLRQLHELSPEDLSTVRTIIERFVGPHGESQARDE